MDRKRRDGRAFFVIALAVAVGVGGLLAAVPSRARAAQLPRLPAGLNEYVGALHEHSGYSDGWPGSRPANYYDSAKKFGLDFLSGAEHSDTANIPVVASELCLGADVVACAGGDPSNPADALRKWDATLEQALAATTQKFTGLRGFEWTSDRFGHISVYFSRHDTNAKIDGGYVDMASFYEWFTRRPELGGGSDGLAVFNHPGAKNIVDDDPFQNWDDFAHEPVGRRSNGRRRGLQRLAGVRQSRPVRGLLRPRPRCRVARRRHRR